ncbi:hypothetical protein AOLI_G00043320 [Acnodon oligacanthus]
MTASLHELPTRKPFTLTYAAASQLQSRSPSTPRDGGQTRVPKDSDQNPKASISQLNPTKQAFSVSQIIRGAFLLDNQRCG